MLGKWTGYYKHESKSINKERRSEKTKFVITITEWHKNEFVGKIEEDVNSGGMKGIGAIRGKLNKNAISFVKKMPIETLFLDGKLLETDKKHPKIFYKGKYDEINNRFIGKWKFKFGFTRINGKFAIRLPIKGIWEMEKID